MRFEIKKIKYFPCKLEIFTINGIGADVYDFGIKGRTGDGEYGCKYCEFKPYRHPADGVLDKYGITYEEFITIGDILQEKLTFTNCGWCK